MCHRTAPAPVVPSYVPTWSISAFVSPRCIYIGNVYLPHSVFNIIQHIDGGQPEPPELPKSSPSLVVVKSDMQP
jgi:hypothetical protein